jgi:type VI protein secretion system component Hcp
MGLWARTGRLTKAALLLAVGLAGGGAAVAVATVPDSSGVIHGCYAVDGSGEPTAGATLTIIDPSAGQTCNPPGTPAANHRELDWNQQGPAGAPGAQGAPGQQGPQGPPGNTSTITKGGTLTLAGGQVLQVEGAGSTVTLPTPSRNLPGGSEVTLGSGTNAVSFPITEVSVLASRAGGASAAKSSVKEISVTKSVDKSSAKLFQACATGVHYKNVTISLRKAGGSSKKSGQVYLQYNLQQVFISSIQSAGSAGQPKPAEQVSFSYGSIKVEYAQQK